MDNYEYFISDRGFYADLILVWEFCLCVWRTFVSILLVYLAGPYAILVHYGNREVMRCHVNDLWKLYWIHGTIPWVEVIIGFSLWVTFVIVPISILIFYFFNKKK